MKLSLEKLALAFLKPFASALLVALVGIGVQPTLRGTVALYLGALVAAAAAGLAALQVYVPNLTFRRWIKDPYGQLLDTFSHGFFPALLISAVGFLHGQDLSAWKAAGSAALIGAFSAGLRLFVQNPLTPGTTPLPTKGVLSPDPRPVSAPASDPPSPTSNPGSDDVTEAPVASEPPTP